MQERDILHLSNMEPVQREMQCTYQCGTQAGVMDTMHRSTNVETITGYTAPIKYGANAHREIQCNYGFQLSCVSKSECVHLYGLIHSWHCSSTVWKVIKHCGGGGRGQKEKSKQYRRSSTHG